MYQSEEDKEDKIERARLARIFRRTAESLNPLFIRGLDADHVRQSLEEVCQYDASTDGHIVEPSLKSIIATLPGAQDFEGLKMYLDPKTDVGRVARISLLTQGSAWTSMSMGIDIPPAPSRKSTRPIDKTPLSPQSPQSPVVSGPQIVREDDLHSGTPGLYTTVTSVSNDSKASAWNNPTHPPPVATMEVIEGPDSTDDDVREGTGSSVGDPISLDHDLTSTDRDAYITPE